MAIHYIYNADGTNVLATYESYEVMKITTTNQQVKFDNTIVYSCSGNDSILGISLTPNDDSVDYGVGKTYGVGVIGGSVDIYLHVETGIQVQLNRINNEVSEQAELIQQIKTALEGKAAGGGAAPTEHTITIHATCLDTSYPFTGSETMTRMSGECVMFNVNHVASDMMLETYGGAEPNGYITTKLETEDGTGTIWYISRNPNSSAVTQAGTDPIKLQSFSDDIFIAFTMPSQNVVITITFDTLG